MRLIKFLSLTESDDNVSKFRSITIDLVESDTGNIELVKEISEKYLLDDSAVMLLDRANEELKKIYSGKHRFDFCLEGECLPLGSVKVDKKKQRQIKEKWFKFNDELSGIQNIFEDNIRKNLHK